jgi:hypothetical protein
MQGCSKSNMKIFSKMTAVPHRVSILYHVFACALIRLEFEDLLKNGKNSFPSSHVSRVAQHLSRRPTPRRGEATSTRLKLAFRQNKTSSRFPSWNQEVSSVCCLNREDTTSTVQFLVATPLHSSLQVESPILVLTFRQAVIAATGFLALLPFFACQRLKKIPT